MKKSSSFTYNLFLKLCFPNFPINFSLFKFPFLSLFLLLSFIFILHSLSKLHTLYKFSLSLLSHLSFFPFLFFFLFPHSNTKIVGNQHRNFSPDYLPFLSLFPLVYLCFLLIPYFYQRTITRSLNPFFLTYSLINSIMDILVSVLPSFPFFFLPPFNFLSL